MEKLLAIIAIVFMFFMVAFIRLYGCATVPVIDPVEITGTISCPYADDITCQKCHTWKKEVANWHNPETGKLGKVEIILPENVDIDFNTGQTVIINPDSLGKDWICENVFYKFSDDLYTLQTLYDRWSLSHLPPPPPLALINMIYYPSLNSKIPDEIRYWIYRKGVPVEVDKEESDLYIDGLRGGVRI